MSHTLGWDVVPETCTTEGPLGYGSAQRFLPEDQNFDPLALLDPEPSPRLWPIAVLDLVINNADRKIGHILQSQAGKLFAIDHGLSFHPEDKLRTVLWGLAEQEIPQSLLSDLERLYHSLAVELGARVQEWLGEEELFALQQRVNQLLSHPYHPQPPQHRPPIPWPVW